ncbi:MAG: OmpH family outer membrane protein [Candidatus Bipolaricaulia bacterium]
MSRNVLYIAGIALIVALGALILQFALPSAGGGDDARLASLERRINDLQGQSTGGDFRVAYLDAEAAFSVFLEVTADLREHANEKISEISDLQNQYAASTISRDEYQQRANELQAELLDAQLTIDISALDRMIGSSDFSDIRAKLQEWKETAELLANEVKNLVSMARMGVVDPLEYQSRYTTANNAFQQFDQGLTQAATLKIVQVAQRIAVEQGFDMVLRVKNVLVYRNPATLIDITDEVKSVISSYL